MYDFAINVQVYIKENMCKNKHKVSKPITSHADCSKQAGEQGSTV